MIVTGQHNRLLSEICGKCVHSTLKVVSKTSDIITVTETIHVSIYSLVVNKLCYQYLTLGTKQT